MTLGCEEGVKFRADIGGTSNRLVEDGAVAMPAERRDGSLGLLLVKLVTKQVRGRAAMVAGLIRPAHGIDQGISLRSGASACGC